MNNFSQDEFNKFIIENNVIGFFEQPIKLVSGRTSHWYVNWRNIVNDSYLLDKVTNFVNLFLKGKNIGATCVYGVPEGATKLGVITSMKRARESENFNPGEHVVSMGRAKPKEHGDPKDRFFVGTPKGETVVIEDTTTTGGSLIRTIEKLTSLGINVTTALILTNRMTKNDQGESVEEAIQKNFNGKIITLSMSNAFDLLPQAIEKKNPNQETIESIKKEFQLYGVKELDI